MIRVLLCIFILLSISPAMAFRVETTKDISLSQFSAELTVRTNVPNIPLRSSSGHFVENNTDVVSVADLQATVDAHVAVPEPPKIPTPPRDWRGEYNSKRQTIPAGPIRDMFDLLAERNNMKDAP